MVSLFVWFAAAWVGGTAAILGSLMAIGTLILWCVPNQSGAWQNQLKLLGFSVGLTIVGFALLFIFSGSPANIKF
ncbi:hypothetical protein C7B65_12525 [Phormidesmis priestleyi ULC007]|uniref:Uncharacterized protein n=1 Tax=Phormidesmis priestleyi ULC007 TaxID=1920490 RepID=A0A2T1DF76_9CYAN|nr:hypothetical protein [Phormidesmis priestleyi]PSB19104.1 hypothetical protein C7B65_12525 [Phormidesmis priestleyi ULC007]PZO49956.1 MAG: hypothetical protein DCF14_12470 [Phormidesmis priestleyi]